MYLNLIDRISETNPQLFRELTSRLKPAQITIAVAISLTGQILSLMMLGNQSGYLLNNPTPTQWKNWFYADFLWFSVIGIFALLVFGTYMLVADLSKEEEKGTLNIIRQTPEAAKKILIGKLLGVPSLLYIVALLALPLHLFTGLSAGISIYLIGGFYAILIASCIFFYSLALLSALIPIGKGNIKAGIFSAGMVFSLIKSPSLLDNYTTSFVNSFNSIVCFFPWSFLEKTFLVRPDFVQKHSEKILKIDWYNLPISSSAIATGIFLVLNYSFWTFWIWRGLQRWFHRPTSNLLTKGESYLLNAGWHITIIGFAISFPVDTLKEKYWSSFCTLILFDLVLYFILVGALTPHYQTIQDWSRYRHHYKFGRKGKLWQDLLLGEKSPAIVAIGINAIVASFAIGLWALLVLPSSLTVSVLSTLAIAISIALIYACVTQLVLLSKDRQRTFLTTVTLISMTILPPMFAIASYTSSPDRQTPWIWLFSIFPWVALSGEAIAPAAVISACIVQWLGITVLGMQLHHRIKAMGTSKLLTAA
jgi:hypothetical protein